MAELILVVDDDHDVAATVELNLTIEGYDVHVVHDGCEALRRARELRPDLVVLDVVLPGLDGYAVCAALRDDPATAHAGVIMLSARTMPDDRVRGLSAGADDYIAKPFSPVELIARVRTVLRRTTPANDVSPLTRLPGPLQISAELERRIADGSSTCAVIDADLTGFSSYNARYGYDAGDELVRYTARVLVATLREIGGDDYFVGHSGGDDFMLLTSARHAEGVCRASIAVFEHGVSGYYDAADVARGFTELEDRRGEQHRHPLVSLAMGIVRTAQRPLATAVETIAVASELRRHAKRHPRSAYEIDRREE